MSRRRSNVYSWAQSIFGARRARPGRTFLEREEAPRFPPWASLCAWKALSSFLREDTGGDALPAAIVSIQTAGEFLNWHPHLHVLPSAGAFRTDGSFAHSPVFAAAVLRDLFQANVLALLLKERKRTEASLPRQRGSVPDHGNKSISEGHREYDSLEWIARLTSHIPERGAQLVHYYGAYSNAHREIATRREVFEAEPAAAGSPAAPTKSENAQT